MATITEIIDKCKQREYEIFVGIIVTLTAIFSFGLGRLSKIESTREPIRIVNETQSGESMAHPNNLAQTKGEYVASKTGTKYYLPWCSGAQRISIDKQIWFKTKQEAERGGYTPALACKGI